MDRLSEDARKLIAKMARATARDFFEEQREEWRELLGADLHEQVESAVREAWARYRDGKRRAAAGEQYMDGRGQLGQVTRETIAEIVESLPPHTEVFAQTRQAKAAAAAERRPVGNCTECGAPWTTATAYTGSDVATGTWHHVHARDCRAFRANRAKGSSI